MAKLYFRYGAMGGGKTLDLLKTADNYERKGREVLLLSPSVDIRDGVGNIKSRIGLEHTAVSINDNDNIGEVIGQVSLVRNSFPDVVLVDEAQFITRKQVIELAAIVDLLEIPVIAYGLKNDFKNNLFEGTSALLAYADSIEEVKTICEYCDSKAIMNMRLNDGVPVKHGEQIQVGDEEYIGVCRECYRKSMDNELN